MAEEGSGSAASTETPAVRTNRNLVYSHLGDLSEKEAELIFSNGLGFERLPKPNNPIFVLLIGSPGSGKSTALSRLPELVGLDPAEAAKISLDALIESVLPFREKTREIAASMLEESGFNPSNNSIPEELISAIASKASGPYLSVMRTKKNNRPGRIGKPLPLSLNEMRYMLLERALAMGLNIIYERTVSDASKNTLTEEVFSRIRASQQPYKVFVVYTKIDDPEVLRKRLYERPLAMMKRNPPFFRGVPASMASKFIGTHEEYFQRYLRPLSAEGIQLVTVFWDGRPDEYEPPRENTATEEETTSATTGKGGRRTRRKYRSRRHRTRGKSDHFKTRNLR